MPNAHGKVALNWALQTGHYRRGRSMFYEGNRIYSWGHHYVAGLLDPEHKVALINSTKHSVSTSQHCSEARSAAHSCLGVKHGWRVIHVPDPEASPEKNLQLMQAAYAEAEAKRWKKFRAMERWHGHTERYEMGNLIAAYGLQRPSLAEPTPAQIERLNIALVQLRVMGVQDDGTLGLEFLRGVTHKDTHLDWLERYVRAVSRGKGDLYV